MRRAKWDYMHWLLLGSVCTYFGIATTAGVLLVREGVKIEYLLLLAAAAGALLYLLITLTVDRCADLDDE